MKSHTFACGCEVAIYDDSADWEPCYIHDVAKDWNDAMHALPAQSLVLIAGVLQKAYQDLPKRSREWDAIDVLRVDILNIGEKKLRTDRAESGRTPFTDLVDQWYKSKLFSQATAWYQAQIDQQPDE